MHEIQTLWRHWKAGQPYADIAQMLGVSLTAVYSVIGRRAGVPPRVRVRTARALSRRERELIAEGLAARWSLRAIARRLGRAPSTVSREIQRNAARTSTARGYQPDVADQRAWDRAARPKVRKLARASRLQRYVVRALRRDWSPRQISRTLLMRYPDEPSERVAAETIYRTLYVQTKATLKAELLAHLRRGRTQRRPATRLPRSRIPDAVSIAERPPEVDTRRVPGHWEGDLLEGAQHTYIATLVERASRYVLLVDVPSKDTLTVTRALARRIRHLPASLRRSLTWDRGAELAAHRQFTVATDVQVYFCDPHSPWQRGTNENTNGLLRQYFPKGMSLRSVTRARLNRVEWLLNTRPRETLGFQTPADVYRTFLNTIPVATIG